jgi:hypothetical protein
VITHVFDDALKIYCLLAGNQPRRVVSSRQFRPKSTISSEARVKAMTPTAERVSPRWLQ